MHPFTLLFLAMLALSIAVEAWLARRQARHVQAHRDTVPEAFRDRVPLADHRKAADYTVARVRFGLVGLAVGTAVLLVWTLGGGVAALNAAWRGIAGDGLLAGTGLLVSALLIGALVELPLAAWKTFVLESRFGFNRTTPGLFVRDTLKSLGLAVALATPLAWAALWLMARAGDAWWAWLWALWIAFNLLLVWAWPRFIAPLFNTFRPLDDPELRARIEALLDRTGFASRGLYVMDGSRRS
ncbi:MAG: M48 family peptidase, partial [Gammaproteobacteria bacterium]|nr:M48 family peptidase [Gammaproteobacteria bacterium]